MASIAQECKHLVSTCTSREFWSRAGVHLRVQFGAGLLLLIPVFVTIWILSLIFKFLDSFLGDRLDDLPVFATVFRRDIPQDIPGLGIVALIVVVYLAGLLGSSVLGRRLFTVGQNLLLNIPVVRTIYFATKQLVESLSGSKSTGLRRVVVIEYPRAGLWALGFLTGFTTNEEKRTMAIVYLPTAPMPNSGWLAVLPVEEVYDTDLTVQDAMQFVLSGGILSPSSIDKRPIQEPTASLTQ